MLMVRWCVVLEMALERESLYLGILMVILMDVHWAIVLVNW